MRKVHKIIIMMIILLFALTIKCYAGSISVSSSGTAEPGSTVNITIKGNNATGRVNLSGSNIKLSQSSVWVENDTKTITGTLTGGDGSTAKVSATPAGDNLVDSTTKDEIKSGASASISIKKKKEVVAPKVEEQAKPAETKAATQPTTQTQKTQTQAQNNSKATTKTATKTETKKDNNQNKITAQSDYKEDQGTVAEFGITSLYIFGVNESGEKTELALSPNFDINVSDYVCSVEENIKSIEIDYEANEYKDLVHAEGLDKELVPGENVIILNMKKDDGTEKNYKIVITKAGEIKDNSDNVETVDNDQNVKPEENKSANSEKKEPIYVKMPLAGFIAMQLGIIAIEILGCVFAVKKIAKGKKKTE